MIWWAAINAIVMVYGITEAAVSFSHGTDEPTGCAIFAGGMVSMAVCFFVWLFA